MDKITPSAKRVLRVAALADLHHSSATPGALRALFDQVAGSADVLLLCGDITDRGLAEEAEVFVEEVVGNLRLPIVSVLGNHDLEAGQQDRVRKTLEGAGIFVLDGDTCEIGGVGFAGVKGFAGGFDRGTLAPWGETVIKDFVREAVEEALKLESALARLQTPHRIALLHYAPIRETVEGELCELFPFLGTSRLEEPLNRYQVLAAFHGHAHNGTARGMTKANVPVYNVSLPVLRKAFPDRPPFHLMEIAVEGEESQVSDQAG